MERSNLAQKQLIPFVPVVGTNEQILSQEPIAGRFSIATDTKKLYYSDGASFLSVGGNSGIYYGVKQIPEDTPSDQINFIFQVQEIDGNENVTDGNYQIPNVNDLILNFDGSFFRVKEVLRVDDIITINTTRLTVSGIGGGGGGSGQGFIQIRDVENSSTKYFTKDVAKAMLRFKVSNTIDLEGNGIKRIKYTIGAIESYEDYNFRDFGILELDLMPYISKLSTVNATRINIFVEDAYGTKGSYDYYINVIDLALTSGYTNNILLLDPSSNGQYYYECTPAGGGSLQNREVVVSLYDNYNNHIKDQIEPVITSNEKLPIVIELPNHGVFTIKVKYRGTVQDREQIIESNILNYQVVYYGSDPQLAAHIPHARVEQYSTLDIEYVAAAVTDSAEKVQVTLRRGSNESIQQISYGEINTWSIYFDTPGFYNLEIELNPSTRWASEIEVYTYEGEIPAVTTKGLTLNLSAINRSNTEINKNSWVSGDYSCTFSDFSWGSINGWMKDAQNQSCLRLSNGAKLSVDNFYPFEKDVMNATGMTIELDFQLSGVTDFSQRLVECLSWQNKNAIQVGFQITGQNSTFNTQGIKATGAVLSDKEEDQAYNTQIQGCTARFIENERIHLTWVIENRKTNKYPMIKTYINGILSGVTTYTKDDSTAENPQSRAVLKFDSTYGVIDIYNIRVYTSTALEASAVLNNYIATFGAASDKVIKYTDNQAVKNNSGKIDIAQIESNFVTYGYKLNIPYIKITGGESLIKSDISGDYTLNTGDNAPAPGLPVGKKDYRLIKSYEFIDQNGHRENQSLISSFKDDNTLNGLVFYGQGTSSMEYPVKNLRIKSKMKDGEGNKVKFAVNDCEVDLICLKADYMESSGSHNTGTGNLIYSMLSNVPVSDNSGGVLETPGQKYWNDKEDYDILTAIRGFPVLVFFRSDENEPYDFIGKYNFNLDKATQEPFGFRHDETSDFGWIPGVYKEVGKLTSKGYAEYPFDLFIKDGDNYIEASSYDATTEYYTLSNQVHCYEFLNNNNPLVKFLKDDGDDNFETTFYKTVTNDEGKEVPNWSEAYESRYPEYGDVYSVNIKSWFDLCNWIHSTKDDVQTFKNEFENHLNLDFTCFYYVLTHVLLMMDSRAKNMMMATWDDQIWYPIFYDMDTMLGLDNSGYNKYAYDVEDTESNVYNSTGSILWNNFAEAYQVEIQNMYNKMQKAGLSYQSLLDNYGKNQADVINETIYNADSDYKYLRPFKEDYYIDDVKVEAGSKDYLYAAQGNRSMHRKWWLKNRINYFNGKYYSDEFKEDRYILRIYTPSSTGDNYYLDYTVTADNFKPEQNDYYLKGEDGKFVKVPPEGHDYDSSEEYYRKAENELNESIKAIPPNNNFTLTPLNKQYLAVQYGNAAAVRTDKPVLGGESAEIKAKGSYNDTETYLCGGSQLKDLGDLSTQYLGKFQFPNQETKLETLILGNPNNKYYNPNFGNLSIGNKAPYLKTLDLSNCIGLKGTSLSVDGCKSLQTLYATGTEVNSISLPEYGFIHELRLPDTINTLRLVHQPYLKDQFTIGRPCDYDPETKIRTYKDADQYENIISLYIDNTPIDSYQLVQKSPALQRFYLKDINWTIDNEQDIDKDDNILYVLEKLSGLESAQTGTTKGQSLIGTITLSSTLGLTVAQALQINNKYQNIFPNINFIFEGLNIYDVIIKNGNYQDIWRAKAIGNDDGTLDITEEFLREGLFDIRYAEITTKQAIPSHTYIFNGKWIIESKRYESELVDEMYWPVISGLTPVNNMVTLIPDFTSALRKYVLEFRNNYDETFKHHYEVEYGSKIKDYLPNEIPYKSDKHLPLTETYAHIGYGLREDSEPTIFTDDDIIINNKIYYAIFEQKNVYDNIHVEYFEGVEGNYGVYENNFVPLDTEYAIDRGIYIRPKQDLKLRGKITIPKTFQRLPVIGISSGAFANMEKITHIFIEGANDESTQLRIIQYSAFYECSNLEYFDFPNSLREIGFTAFYGVPLKPSNDGVFSFGDHIYFIGQQAFQKGFQSNGLQSFDIILPATIRRIGKLAFRYLNLPSAVVNFQIGTVNNYAPLAMSDSGDDYPWMEFNTHKDANSGAMIGDPYLGNVIFYSANYTNWLHITSNGLSLKHHFTKDVVRYPDTCLSLVSPGGATEEDWQYG